MRFVLAALVAGAIPITMLAAAVQEERPGPQRPPRVLPPVAAELVEVDVVVTDRRGEPVSDLRPEDFVLLEDGKPQRVAFFLAGDVGQPAAPSPAAAPLVERPAPLEVSRTPGRFVVLAIDDWHMGADSLVRAKDALRHLVDDQLTSEDQVAVVTTSGSVGLVQPFTSERATLRHAIARIGYQQRRADAGGRATMSEYQAEAIERGDPLALELALREIEQREGLIAPTGGGRNPRLELEARSMARSLLSQALEMSRTTLKTLEEALNGLAGVPGRKLVVLVSDGFLLGSGTAESHRIDLRALMDLATRSRASVFALHARGLLAMPTGGDASRPASLVQTLPGLQERYEREEDLALREGMGDLAESTGGFLLHGTNDLEGALARILRANAAAYLLAYEPSGEGGGRFRRIEVKLPRHPELQVHARRGYFSADERTARASLSASRPEAAPRSRRDAAIRLALASLVPLSDVPLRMAADFVEAPKEGPRVVIRAHVDLPKLAFESVGGRQEADLEFVSVVYGENGSVAVDAEGQRAEMRLSPANHERLMREGLGYQRSVAIKPGAYQVRVVVREERSGRLGSAWRWIEVPDLATGALTLSDVLLLAEPATTPGEATRTGLKDVQAQRRYARGANLYYVVYAYNPTRNEAGQTDVVAQAQVWWGGRAQGASAPEPLAFDGKTASASGRIALQELPAGEYELRLLLVDRKAQATVQKRVGFSIE